MILEIIGIFFGSVTVITCSALKLVNVLDQRDRDEDERERKQEERDNAVPTPIKVYPFVDFPKGGKCPLCAMPAGSTFGVNNLLVCRSPKECSAAPLEHMHAYCRSCRTNYFMKPATVIDDYVKMSPTA